MLIKESFNNSKNNLSAITEEKYNKIMQTFFFSL